MRHIKSYKIYESEINKPIMKYPVGYKCMDIDSVRDRLIKVYDLDLYEIPCVESKYGTMNFFRWCSDNLTPLYPNHTLSEEHHKFQMKQYAGTGIPYSKQNYFEKDAVYELPISYDSSGDLEKWTARRDKYREDMTKMAEMRGSKYNIGNEKNVDFGPKSNEWVNIALSKIHELYGEYYVNDKLRIWNSESGYDDDKNPWDYPMNKSYFLSDLEKWISDTFDVDTNGFYEWILRCQYVEGRHWEMTWEYEMDDINFRKQKAPENIKQINEILRQLYKVESMDIYIDYYKKVNFN